MFVREFIATRRSEALFFISYGNDDNSSDLITNISYKYMPERFEVHRPEQFRNSAEDRVFARELFAIRYFSLRIERCGNKYIARNREPISLEYSGNPVDRGKFHNFAENARYRRENIGQRCRRRQRKTERGRRSEISFPLESKLSTARLRKGGREGGGEACSC